MILDNYPMVDMQNDEGDTPLHISVRLDHKEIIRELESRGRFKPEFWFGSVQNFSSGFIHTCC